MSRVFICGDTHATISWAKLNSKNFPIGKELTKDDYVIVCGDFGAIWDGGKQDKYILDWYESKPWTTLFVDGNHENHDMLDSYPVSEWHGGKVHFIRPSVIHLMRGQIFEINGRTFFTMGGAQSTDKWARKEGVSWWAREMPSDEEYDEAIKNLECVGQKVDFIISHCASDSVEKKIVYDPWHNKLTNFFEVISSTIEYTWWFCGHYHTDIHLDEYSISILYNDIMELDFE